ncbi:MAG: SusC/RagA family TonB-linked outer membrane protein [Bacteroidaceae bacterium]|nr:SusC/RagA family TonB-linked outer membrane protein [Bacteroidaceae bacterium]
MNKISLNFKQRFFRVGALALCLSGALSLSAQEAAPATDGGDAPKSQIKPQVETREVSGHIYDAATHQPLSGVRVQALANRKYTAMTDAEGAYTIKVPTFVTAFYISTDGYNATQLAIKGAENQDAVLYRGLISEQYTDGTTIVNSRTAKLNLTSAQTVEPEIENVLHANVRTISRGGLNAQGAVMLINGINSLNTNAQPLVVVDGVIWDMQYDRATIHDGFVNNVLNLLDPEDIDRVEVLKNGTALYGAKGANGVLIIDTKRGHSMATRINVRVYGGFETAPSRIKMMNGSQFRSYATELLGTTDIAENMSSNMTVPFLVEDPQGYRFYEMYHQNVDWQKDLYRTAFTQNYKVNVQGGDDVAMYNLSLGYTDGQSTAKKNDFNRLNIRFNTDVNLFEGFTTAIDLGYTRSAYDLRDNGWAQDYSSRNISSPNVLGLLQSPFISPYMYFVYYNMQTGLLDLGHSNEVYAGKVFSEANNPLAYASAYGFPGIANPYWILQNGSGNNKNFQEQTQFNLNIAPRYQVNRYLTLSDRFSYQLNRTNEKYYLPYNGTPTIDAEGLGQVNNAIRSQFSKSTVIFNDFRVDWRKQFDAHWLNLFGGMRFTANTYTSSFLEVYNNDNDKMPNIDYSLQYRNMKGDEDEWRSITWYANADYNYKNLYFLTVTASMESSSRFGKEAKGGVKLAGVEWGLFPSVQAGWLISSEKWFNVPSIDYLKLTLGYDMSGNDAIDYYASRTYFKSVPYLERFTALVLANTANPELSWETTHRFNVGLQSAMLKNRLSFGLNLYYAKTVNLLTFKTVSDITGQGTQLTNDGSLKNLGLDLNVDGILINTKDWKWQAGFTVGHYHNEITKLPKSPLNVITTYALDANGNKVGNGSSFTGYTSAVYAQIVDNKVYNNILTAVGRPAGVFYGYKTAGVFSTDAEASTAGKYGYLRYPTGITEQPYRNFKAGDVHFVDQNGDGWINEADMVEIGDPNPDFYGNIYSRLTYKRLTLDVNLKFSVGNDVFNYQRMQLESASQVNVIGNQTRAVVNRWRYDGQKTDIPRTMYYTNKEWVNNERFSDRWIEDGSYLKLKKVRLTWETPISLSWLQGITLWGEANNVFTLTKYLGSDPEVTAGNGVLYQGIDAGLLPASRSFNFGVTINL